jgi:lantibiotic modifying enzyme
MSWQPLLAGDLKDRALECAKAVSAELALQGRGPAGDPSLAGGTAGLALLDGYLTQTERGSDHPVRARRHLQQAITAAAEKPTEASLYSGLTGVGWVIAHLQGRLADLDGEEDAAEIDDVLLHHLDQSPWSDDYDLVNGLVGLGIYALERLPRPAALTCLERVIGHLAETAEQRADGFTWWTNPAWLPPDTREKFPHGYFNLGLAHGVPGVIALLGRACAAGFSRARPLLEGAVGWLLAQQGKGGFPCWVGAEAQPLPARLAWCYGDPGVAAALLGAARAAREPAWEGEALAIALRAARRRPEESGVVDAGLCHGAAGLGHLFNRIYQATGEPELATAARSWFERALTMRQPGCGIGGFQAWLPGADGAQAWVTDPGLLTGAAGIALALLAAATPIEPAWDRVLLTAIRPCQESEGSRP